VTEATTDPAQLLRDAYAVDGPAADLGRAVLGGAVKPDVPILGDFLQSRQGKALQREVLRGVFGMLRKRL